jgi:4'-phosphopantetheinyl transferase
MARGILRMILAGYLGRKPNELSFEYTSFGKPGLAEKRGNDTISFNLSHSDDMVLYAVTLNRNIDIDVERIKNNVDVVQIANRFFSASEIRSLDVTPEKERPENFFQYWTRKEALVKAIGKGVSFPFEQCDVSLANYSTLAPIKLTGINMENSCWHVQDLFPGDDYVAAIAAERKDLDISYWDYQC